jgi:PIN domain nuclease of toxin-antitoxin system
MNQGEDKKIQVSIVMSKETKIKYAKLAVEMDMSFSQLVRRALRELGAKTKKDQAATRS